LVYVDHQVLTTVTLQPGALLMDDLSHFCCQNPACSDHGLRGRDNLRVGFRYGKHRRLMLVCRTCQHRSSERKGTALFATRLPQDQAVSVFRHLQEGCGVRQTARLCGVDKDTVGRYGRPASTHARQTHDEVVAFSPSDPGGAVR
jgi:transposase-like protein